MFVHGPVIQRPSGITIIAAALIACGIDIHLGKATDGRVVVVGGCYLLFKEVLDRVSDRTPECAVEPEPCVEPVEKWCWQRPEGCPLPPPTCPPVMDVPIPPCNDPPEDDDDQQCRAAAQMAFWTPRSAQKTAARHGEDSEGTISGSGGVSTSRWDGLFVKDGNPPSKPALAKLEPIAPEVMAAAALFYWDTGANPPY